MTKPQKWTQYLAWSRYREMDWYLEC